MPMTARTAPVAEEPPAVPALFAGVVWDAMLDGSMRAIIERQALVPFLAAAALVRRQGAAARRRRASSTGRRCGRGAHPAFLTIVEAEYRDGGRERYVAAARDGERRRGRRRRAAARRRGRRAHHRRAQGPALRRPVRRRDVCDAAGGHAGAARAADASTDGSRAVNLGLDAERGAGRALAPITPHGAADQSNTSVLFGDAADHEAVPPPRAGPESRRRDRRSSSRRAASRACRRSLRHARRTHAPATGRRRRSCMLQRVRPEPGQRLAGHDRGAGPLLRARAGRAARWRPTAAGTDRARRDAPPPDVAEAVSTYLATAEVLGRRTGELHVQLARGEPDDAGVRARAVHRRPTSARRPTRCGGMPTEQLATARDARCRGSTSGAASWPRRCCAHRDRAAAAVRRARARARRRRAHPLPRRLSPRTGARSPKATSSSSTSRASRRGRSRSGG